MRGRTGASRPGWCDNRLVAIAVDTALLDEVVGALDATVLRVVHAHADLAVPVHAVSILDRTDPESVHAHSVVLAVGVTPEEGEAVALLDRAGRSHAAAVVLRCAGTVPQRLCDIAVSAEISLLAVPPEMDWGQLYALMRTAMSGAGATRSSAAGVRIGDLFALADAVAAAVGAPVTVEDPQWRVLAYSNLDGQAIDDARRETILGRTPPGEWQERLDHADMRRQLRSHEGLVHFEHEGLAPRVVAPVRAGGEFIGSLWVAQSEGPLSTEAEEKLRQFADLAAIHLIAHRSDEDLKRRSRGLAVREMLEGRSPAGEARRTGPLSTVAFAFTGEGGEPWTGDPERILSVVGLYAESLHRDALSALLDDHIWVVVPTPAARAREVLVEMASSVADRAGHALHVRVRAAVGVSVPAVADLPHSRRTAEQALAVLSARGGDPVVHAEDVRSQTALMELLEEAAGISGLRDGKVTALAAHDAQHGTEFVGTLAAWLDHHGDVGRAAEALGLHRNTMRYRIRRISDVSGIDLEDPDERLVAAIELRLLAR